MPDLQDTQQHLEMEDFKKSGSQVFRFLTPALQPERSAEQTGYCLQDWRGRTVSC